MTDTNPAGTGTESAITTDTQPGIQTPMTGNPLNPTEINNSIDTGPNYTSSSAINNTPTINTDSAINYDMTISTTPSLDMGRMGTETTPQYTGKDILPVPAITLYSGNVKDNKEEPKNTTPDYNLTGTVPVQPQAPPNIQNIFFNNDFPPSINYTGKGINLPKKYLEPETEELSLTDLYKQALDKHKIKKQQMSLKEFIDILTGSIDEETKDIQYISAIEIALKKYIKENSPINRHNTDLYALITGETEELEAYKQEAKAYLEFFQDAKITYEIDDKLTKIIDTKSGEYMEHVSAITPEIRDYLIGLDEAISTYIEKSNNTKDTTQIDNSILSYLESSAIPTIKDIKTDQTEISGKYPLITTDSIGIIPKSA